MFKVVVNDGAKLPNDKIFYIVAKNGVFLKKRIGIVESLTPVDGVSFLEEVKPFAKLDIPKIPIRTFGRIMTFFRKIYELHHSECSAILYYNESRKEFRTVIPPQEVSASSVKYLRIPSMEGYVRLSTIHSHPGFSAFHSGTDKSDEEDSDGLHITLGKIDKEIFEVVSSIVANGSRFKVEPVNYIEGIEKVITEVEETSAYTFGSSYFSQLKEFLWGKPTVRKEVGYKFSKWQKKFEVFNLDWIKEVKPIVYTYTYPKYNQDVLTFDEYKEPSLSVRDILPIPEDVKLEGKEENSFNPCRSCAFRSFKSEEKKEQDKKELTEEFYGI